MSFGNHRVDQTVDHFGAYLFRKRGIYYYSRRVPKALQERLNKHRVSFSLRTRSIVKARALAARVTSRLDVVWAELWLENQGIMLKDRSSEPLHETLPPSVHKTTICIADASSQYLRLKGHAKNALFHTTTQRNTGYLIDCLGNIEITAIGRSEAGKFRDFLINKGLSHTSIRRVFSTVKAMLNMAISEFGLNCANPFSRLFIPNIGEKTKRPPISSDNIHAIQRECMVLDDRKRWLIALISDTGLRLAEAVGLVRSDVKLDDIIPHVIVQVHPWRPLKTLSSARIVPLVGAAKWAAERAIVEAKSAFLFPEYASLDGCNANSASAALNKWLKPRVPENTVIHSFRHALRDRLRQCEAPADIVDALGGWTTQGVGHSYGTGYTLEVKAKWMQKIVLKCQN